MTGFLKSKLKPAVSIDAEMLREWLLFMGESSLDFWDVEAAVRQLLLCVNKGVVQHKASGVRGTISGICLKNLQRKFLVVYGEAGPHPHGGGTAAMKAGPWDAAGRGYAGVELRWDGDTSPEWFFLEETENAFQIEGIQVEELPTCLAPALLRTSEGAERVVLTSKWARNRTRVHLTEQEVRDVLGSGDPLMLKHATSCSLDLELLSAPTEEHDYKISVFVWDRDVKTDRERLRGSYMEMAIVEADLETAVRRIVWRHIRAVAELFEINTVLNRGGFQSRRCFNRPLALVIRETTETDSPFLGSISWDEGTVYGWQGSSHGTTTDTLFLYEELVHVDEDVLLTERFLRILKSVQDWMGDQRREALSC